MMSLLRPLRVFLPILLVTLGHVSAARAGYEQCTTRNDYFERHLEPRDAFNARGVCEPDSNNVPQNFDQLDQVSDAVALPAACVLASMQSTPDNVYRFGFCNRGRPPIRTSHVAKPCISERYHFFTYLSYLQAMKCLGLDPREMFGLLNSESNFHMNIGSYLGAWGVGQLTTVAVGVINTQKKLAPYASRPECAEVKSLLETPMPTNNSCQWISAPENPARSFLYAGSVYLTFRQIAAGLVARARPLSKLSPQDRERVIFDLAAYMYNGGDAGVRQAFNVYMSELGRTKVTYAAFSSGFKAYLGENFGTGIAHYESNPERLVDKRREVSRYLDGVDAQLAQVEKKAGVKCSRW